jgi:hypothetical protein
MLRTGGFAASTELLLTGQRSRSSVQTPRAYRNTNFHQETKWKNNSPSSAIGWA